MRSILNRIEKLENKTTNKDGKLGLIPIHKFSSLKDAAIAFNKFRGTNFTAEDLSKWDEHTMSDGKRWLMHPNFKMSTIVLERKKRLTTKESFAI